MTPSSAFPLVWGLWFLSWLAAAFWSSSPVKRSPTSRLIRSNVTILIGAVLLFTPTPRALGTDRLWHVGHDGAWALVLATVASFAFVWWARIYLGTLWSGAVTLKAHHRVVDSGPYALVRHPIYTGLIAAALATATAVATLPAVVGAALIGVGLWLKARIEEEFLAQELGAEAYAAYRRRVPMLVPFMPAR